MNIISIGEILWDVIGEAEHLGGAPFNFAAHAGRLGHAVSFISAVGADARGRRALERMAGLGLSTRFVRQASDQPTGMVSVDLDPSGQPHFTIPRPAAYDFPQLSPSELDELGSRKPDWIYFGTLQQMSPQARALTRRLMESAPGARRFYDVNFRAGCYTASLVGESMECAGVVKLNEEEACAVAKMFGRSHHSLEDFCRSQAEKFRWDGVCVTRGASGCVALIAGHYVEARGYAVTVTDAVGAGDAFSAAFVHGLGCGWTPNEVADFANRVGALVASRRGAIPPWTLDEAMGLA